MGWYLEGGWHERRVGWVLSVVVQVVAVHFGG